MMDVLEFLPTCPSSIYSISKNLFDTIKSFDVDVGITNCRSNVIKRKGNDDECYIRERERITKRNVGKWRV
jgi:hypothetical protein